jgi:hypothetical protein
MAGELVSVLITDAVMHLFFRLLRARANRLAKREATTGDLILQCSPILAWTMGLIAVGGPLGMAVLLFAIPAQNKIQMFAPLAVGAFCLILGGLMCLWALKRRTRVGERGLISEYIFAGPRFLAWEEVTKVDFANGLELWVRGASGQKAMLYVWFTGVKEAVPLLRAHLPEAVQQANKAAIDRFSAAVEA